MVPSSFVLNLSNFNELFVAVTAHYVEQMDAFTEDNQVVVVYA